MTSCCSSCTATSPNRLARLDREPASPDVDTGVRRPHHPSTVFAMTDIDVVRAIYAAMAASDLGDLFEHLDATIVITQDPALPWGGRHVGHDGFAGFGLALRS